MQNFDSWLLELLEDQIWYERASIHHKKETFEATALKVYTLGISDSQSFFIQPMKEHRNHVYNKLCKLPHDKPKKPWYEIKLKEEEEKRKASEPEWIPLTGEERQKRLQEYLDLIQATPPVKRIAPLSHKEIIENGDWKPKPEAIHEPSELEKIAAARKHYAIVRQSRGLLFIEAYPDASPEEVNAYLDKFEKLDNPLGLTFENPHDLPY